MWKRTVVTTGVVLVGLVLAGAGCRQSSPAAATTAASAIPWRQSLPEALQAAQAEGKPLLVDFFATWCGPCRMMDEETWPRPEVAAAAQAFIPVRLDVDANQQVARQYDITGVPTVVFLDASGKELDRQVGFATAEEMLGRMTKIRP